MTIRNTILLFVVAVVLNSCNVDSCDVDCVSGPLSLNFELLDKATGENLFTNDTFDAADISVLDLDNNNSIVPFTFISENDLNRISLGPFGWGTNVANYQLKVGDRAIFTLNVAAEEIRTNCCATVVLNKLIIGGADYSQNTQNGVYEILVEI